MGTQTLTITLIPNTAVWWTTISPSADSRIIYVSTSGNDGDDGLSEVTPKQTIAAGLALLRNGYPDHLLFKRGDTFNGTIGTLLLTGRSADEPMVIGAYGSGTRPIIDTDTAMFFQLNGYVDGVAHAGNYLAIQGLDIYPSGRDPNIARYTSGQEATNGIWLTYGDSILIEDCRIRYYSVGLNIGACNNVTIRGCEIDHNYDGNFQHSQGIYADGVDGLLIEYNTFDHNGWDIDSDQDVFNHNLYIKETVTDFAFRYNITARASSHGIQARAGGDIHNNLFVDNSIHMSFGLQNSHLPKVGGVSGLIDGNVFIGGKSINGSARGWAIEFGNIKDGQGTTCENNVFIGDGVNTESAAAIAIAYSDDGNDVGDVGINDLTIQNNVFYGWWKCINIDAAMIPGSGNGGLGLTGLVVQNNDFQAPTSGICIDHAIAFNGTYETWSTNRYHASGDGSTWFQVNGVSTSFTSWHATIDTAGTNTNVSYSASSQTVGTYSGSISDTGTTATFLNHATGQERTTWQYKYTAAPVLTYLKGGFDL